MKLEKWALIAEIVGSFAVVVTLALLIVGVRANTEVIRVAEYGRQMDGFNDFQTSLLDDPDSLRVWRSYIYDGVEDSNEIDITRLDIMVLTIFRNYESAYFARKYGQIGEAEWVRFDRNMCARYANAISASRVELLVSVLTDEFMEYVIDVCAD